MTTSSGPTPQLSIERSLSLQQTAAPTLAAGWRIGAGRCPGRGVLTPAISQRTPAPVPA